MLTKMPQALIFDCGLLGWLQHAWSVVQQRVYQSRMHDIDEPKRRLGQIWACNFPKAVLQVKTCCTHSAPSTDDCRPAVYDVGPRETSTQLEADIQSHCTRASVHCPPWFVSSLDSSQLQSLSLYLEIQSDKL